MYFGRFKLGDPLRLDLRIKTLAGVPTAPDEAPAFDLYSNADSPSNRLLTKKMGLCDFYRQPSRFSHLLRLGRGAGIRSGTITNATNASPIVVTSASHGLANGQEVTIWGVVGNGAANGVWRVANVAANTFELSGSTGSGGWVSGGKWNMTGLFCLQFRWAFSSSQRSSIGYFEVQPAGEMDGTVIAASYFRPNLERNTALIQTDQGLIIGLRNPQAP